MQHEPRHQTRGSAMAEFQHAVQIIREMDQRPCPRALVAHRRVPCGRAYRQWNTRGELIVWVNYEEMKKMACLYGPPKELPLGAGSLSAANFGVPIYFIDRVSQLNA